MIRKFSELPLNKRLSAYIMMIALGILLAVYLTNYFVSKSIILDGIEDDSRNLAEAKVNTMQTFLTGVEKIPEAISSLVKNYPYDSARVSTVVKELLRKNPGIYGMCIAYEPSFRPDSLPFAPYYYRDKEIISYTDLAKEEYKYEYWDWYQIPYKIRKSLWSEPYYDTGGGENLMITYSVPIIDSTSGKVFGIVTADVDLNLLRDIVSQIRIKENGFAFAISRFGTFISHRNADYILNETIFSLAESKEDDELELLGHKMTGGESGFQSIIDPSSGEEHRLCFIPLKSAGWSVGIMIPESDLFSGLYFLSNMILLVGFIGASILAVFIYFVIEKTTKPVSTISDVVALVANGNLKAAAATLEVATANHKDVDNESASSHDEIIKLWHYIRKMIFDLNGLSIRIKSAGNYLHSSAGTLSDAAAFLNNTFTEQDTANKNVRHYGDEIDRITVSLVSNTEKLTRSVEDTGNLIMDGQTNIGNIGNSIIEISRTTGSIVQKLNNINKRTANISRVITTISNIADRTNLISLNAAIEAEKAGDAGAGFKVIADEIKRLSENTFNSLNEIEEIIQDVKVSVADGVDSVSKYHERSLSGFNEIQGMINDLSVILEKNKELIPQFEIFREAMSTAQESVAAINGNLMAVEKLSQETRTAIGNLIEVSETVNDAVTSLEEEVNKLITD